AVSPVGVAGGVSSGVSTTLSGVAVTSVLGSDLLPYASTCTIRAYKGTPGSPGTSKGITLPFTAGGASMSTGVVVDTYTHVSAHRLGSGSSNVIEIPPGIATACTPVGVGIGLLVVLSSGTHGFLTPGRVSLSIQR